MWEGHTSPPPTICRWSDIALASSLANTLISRFNLFMLPVNNVGQDITRVPRHDCLLKQRTARSRVKGTLHLQFAYEPSSDPETSSTHDEIAQDEDVSDWEVPETTMVILVGEEGSTLPPCNHGNTLPPSRTSRTNLHCRKGGNNE